MAQQKLDSYLDRINFDPNLLTSFKAKYLTNLRLVALLMITIVIIGLSSFASLPRRLNPEVKIPIVTVVTALPGAGPEDVESLVTIPLEDSINNIKGIDTLQSTSQNNVSIISLQFLSSVNGEQAKTDVQAAVDSVTNLPSDAQTPKVTLLDFENQPVWQFAVGTSGDYASLARFAETLKDKLEDIPSIDRVTVAGNEKQDIEIIVRSEAAQEYGVNPQTISRAIQAATASYPAGTVTANNMSFSLSIDPQVTTVDDLRAITIKLNDQVTTLGSIATVIERSKNSQPQSYFANNHLKPQRSIVFSVFKSSSANIDQAANAAKAEVNKQLKPYGNQFSVANVMDTSAEISKSFNDLFANYRDTLILVFIVLFIFLGIRQALIAVTTIPLTFFVTFAIMQATGITLNFLSLFSLLLSLGLLVDDTIVVVTAMTSYYRTGKFTPTETGLLVWRDFIVPIWSTTITAVWAFLPLLLATGIIGVFIKTIPIVVSTSLYVSTAVAVLITLPLMMIILRPKVARRVKITLYMVGFSVLFGAMYLITRTNPFFPLIVVFFTLFLLVTYSIRAALLAQISVFIGKRIDPTSFKTRYSRVLEHGLIDIPVLAKRYQQAVLSILASQSQRRKTILIVVLFSLFSYILVPLGFVVNEFFPKADQDNLYISAELPQGTAVEVSNQEALALLNQVRTTPGLEYATVSVGQQAPTGFNAGSASPSDILVSLKLVPSKDRKQSSITIAQNLRRNFKDYAKGKVSVIELSGGPPAGADVQITVLGDSLQTLELIGDQLQDYLQNQPGIANITKSIRPGTSKLVFVPDKAKMAEAGVTPDIIGGTLRTFASGFKIDSLRLNNKTTDITFQTDANIQDPSALGTITIPTQQGPVPLLSLGNVVLKANPTQIARESGKRSLTVSAAVTQGYSVARANQALLDHAKSMKLPEGYAFKTGGVNEENQRSVQSIFRAMVIAALLIMITMVVQLGSFRKAFIVMLVIPLAVSGVFIVFALTGTPLSFPALIGVLSLFGVVVYQAMLIVDKITRNQAVGMPLKASIADAAASRLEPIMLGTICTIAGLTPITITDPLWRGLGGAIIAGMLFSGAIMLFFIPTLYYMWFKEEQAPSN